jgi:hypothetical protein
LGLRTPLGVNTINIHKRAFVAACIIMNEEDEGQWWFG